MRPARSDPVSDEELVRRFQAEPQGAAGRAAAEELFARYDARVYLWCFRFVRRHEAALDLAQDVLLLAYRGLPAFEGRACFSSWLFAIARHRCLRAVRPPRWVQDDAVELDELPATGSAGDLELEREEEEILELSKAILEPTEQTALWLRCYEGFSVPEITRMLSLDSASGARGVLQSARRKLRAAIERRERGKESGGR